MKIPTSFPCLSHYRRHCLTRTNSSYQVVIISCSLCSKQYVGQTLNKFSTRWNAHHGTRNYFDASAVTDKAALLKHFYKHHDLTEKPHISQFFKVAFVEQPKATYLAEYENEWFHKINAEIKI